MGTPAYIKRHRELGLCRSCDKPLAEGNNSYCLYHREKGKIRTKINDKKALLKYKNECLDQYGNFCKCCGETIKQFLSINHEHGNGNNHRRQLFKHNVGGLHMYRWLSKNNFPRGYTVLCMNCNWATRYGGKCPHELER